VRKSARRIRSHVSRKIIERCAQIQDGPLVVIARNGEAARVWGFDEYLARKELAKKVKPWEKRRVTVGLAQRLGAIDAAAPHPLTRASIYDMDED